MANLEQEIKSIKKKKKKSVWKWALVLLVVVGVVLGINAYRFKKTSDLRRAAFAEQQQVLVDAWKAQGLSQEEIDQKLKAARDTRFQSGDRPQSLGIMRVLTGGRGMGH